MPTRRRRPTIFEQRIGKDESMVREDMETRQLSKMVDHWHKIKMEKYITEETKEKKLND